MSSRDASLSLADEDSEDQLKSDTPGNCNVGQSVAIRAVDTDDFETLRLDIRQVGFDSGRVLAVSLFIVWGISETPDVASRAELAVRTRSSALGWGSSFCWGCLLGRDRCWCVCGRGNNRSWRGEWADNNIVSLGDGSYNLRLSVGSYPSQLARDQGKVERGSFEITYLLSKKQE